MLGGCMESVWLVLEWCGEQVETGYGDTNCSTPYKPRTLLGQV
jgi:hypothetical protein